MVTKIFVGGAPVFRNDAEKYAMAFPTATITILYGSTEAEPISAIGIGDFLALEASVEGLPVGPPIGEIRVKIWPEKQDASLEPLVGEICVTGDHVLKAYYKSPEEFARNKFEEDGELWHRTGDAGYLDAHGNLVLMGRMSRRFVRDASASPTMLSTMRVAYYPIAVEKKLRSIPGITTGTILQSGGRKHERSRIVAFVETLRLVDHARNLELKSRVLELFPFLDEVRVLTTPLPRDPRHRSKIDYEKLESMIANV